MATEVKDDSKAGTGGEGAAGGQQTPPEVKAAPPPDPAKADAKPDPKVPPAKDPPKPEPDGKPPGEAKKAKAIGADDELPEDDDLLTLTSGALKKRLTRATTKELKDRFGTTDVDSIKAKLERLDALEKKEEDQRRAALDEKTRLEEDKKKAEERADAAERKWALAQNERVVEKEDGRISTMAKKHIDEDYLDVVLPKLARHLRDTYTAKEMETLKDGVIEKWFADYAKSKPKLARDAEKVEPKTEKLNNGADDRGRPSQKGSPDMAAKTFKPGQPNTMSRAEMARLGINY